MFIGFVKSPLEHHVRKVADRTLLFLRTRLFNPTVETIVGTKEDGIIKDSYFPWSLP